MRAPLLPLFAWAALGLWALHPGAGAALARSRTKAAAHSSSKKIQHGKAATKNSRRGRGKGRKKREPPPQMPSQIELTALDLMSGIAQVEVVGTTRPPATRLFILTDHSGRRFVPAFAECHPPLGVTLPDVPPDTAGEEGENDEPAAPDPKIELPASTRWRCSLTIPRLYRRAPLTSLTMEWGHLAVAAPADTVQRLWGEARAAAPRSAVAERAPDAQGQRGEPTAKSTGEPETEDAADDDAEHEPEPEPVRGESRHN